MLSSLLLLFVTVAPFVSGQNDSIVGVQEQIQIQQQKQLNQIQHDSIRTTTTTVVDDDVHVLIYETEKDLSNTEGNDNDKDELLPAQRLVEQINKRLIGVKAQIFGQGNKFKGFGSKYNSVLPILNNMMKNKQENSLVIISDGRDVLINNPNYDDNTYSNLLIDEFKMSYEELTFDLPNSIIISAEAQCCVSALTHIEPGQYYNKDGSRNKYSCNSGEKNCLWKGDDKALPWESFMNEMMIERTTSSSYELFNNNNNKNKVNSYDDMYLNAGLMVGKVKDLIRIINKAQIKENEDDQAVLTDYMYHNPNDIILDYSQKLFGNNRGGINENVEGCVFHLENKIIGNRLIHSITNTIPLFIHSPGGFYQCHDTLSKLLNIPIITKTIRRRLKQNNNKDTMNNERILCNYGQKKLGTLCVGDVVSTPTPVPTTNTTVPEPETKPSMFEELLSGIHEKEESTFNFFLGGRNG